MKVVAERLSHTKRKNHRHKLHRVRECGTWNPWLLAMKVPYIASKVPSERLGARTLSRLVRENENSSEQNTRASVPPLNARRRDCVNEKPNVIRRNAGSGPLQKVRVAQEVARRIQQVNDRDGVA